VKVVPLPEILSNIQSAMITVTRTVTVQGVFVPGHLSELTRYLPSHPASRPECIRSSFIVSGESPAV